MDLTINMEDVQRPRLPPLHTRSLSAVTDDSDSTASSPADDQDDENDFFMNHVNDSQSTIDMPQEIGSSEDLEQKHRISPVSKLPSELLIAIFTKLTTTADLRNCMLVSEKWALHAVSILWHRPLCNKWSNLLNVVAALADSNMSFFRYHEMVRRLNLSALADKVSDGTVQPFTNCKRVERLTLTNCAKLTDFGVSGLVEGSKHLQALDVTDIESITDRTLFTVAKNCVKLQGLNVTNCFNITDESLFAVSERCRQLKRLKLNNVVQITDLSVISVAKNCRLILEIDLGGCPFVTADAVTALLSNLSHLRELRLAHCTRISDPAFMNLPPKLQFDSLRILDLTACEHIRDDAIARIIPAASRLRNLVLAKCKNITDRAVLSICKLGKNLHYIHLGHCANLTDAAVVHLVKACNRIRYIDLACCSRLTDASVRHLAQLPKLRRIGLVKCQNLTDQSILALAHGPIFFDGNRKICPPLNYSSLERVHLSYCVNLTRQGITALLNNCPRLTHLSLTGVQAFLRDDLTQFCRDAPAEFTHPQRDVFCVFSGDGVHRLREYLLRIAQDDAERQGQDQELMDENVFEGGESPADTMSEDDMTIDGHDFGLGGTSALHRHALPIVSAPHGQRPRPRSLHDLPTYHVELPLFGSDQMTRVGPITPNAPLTPEMRATVGPPHLNLMSSTSNLHHYEHEFDFRSRSPHLDLGPRFEERPRSSSRNTSRRHTLETSLGLYTPQPIPPYGPYPEGHLRTYAPVGVDDEDRRGMPGPSSMLMPPGPPRRISGQHPGLRNGHSFLRPDPSFSTYDANHEAIMATIPRSRGVSREPSRSSSPHISRVSSRSRLGLLGFMQSSSPAQYNGLSSTLGRQMSRAEEARHNAMLQAMMADTEQQLRERRSQSRDEVEMPFFAQEAITLVPPITPHTPYTPTTALSRESTTEEPRAPRDGEDVQMTQ